MIITRAAIMFSNGEILEGHNYGDISNIANKIGFSGDKIYGFTTGAGDFVLPVEAAKIALDAGQIKSDFGSLMPEDLWPGMADE